VVNLRWRYFGSFWSYVDCALIAMSISSVFTILACATPDQLKTKLTKLDRYQDFYTPASTRHTLDLAIATVLFLAWIKVCLLLLAMCDHFYQGRKVKGIGRINVSTNLLMVKKSIE